MKASTKLQKQIVHLSNNHLPKLTNAQKKYAYKHAIEHVAFLTKHKTNCMECGYQWKRDKVLEPKWHNEILPRTTTCPKCKTKLKALVTNNKTGKDESSFNIVTTCKGFQVIRYFEVNASYKTKQAINYNIIERNQIWIAPNGKYEVIGYSCNHYYNRYFGDFSLKHRGNVNKYKSEAYVTYSRVRYIPEVERNGFYGDFMGCNRFDFIKGILSSSYCETLLKSDYKKLFKISLNDYYLQKIKKYWPSIKIALRNHYHIHNDKQSDYLDYLFYLKEFNKDLHSPKYVCPKDLHEEHQKYVEKAKLKREKEALEERLVKEKQEQIAYQKHIKKFSKLSFKLNNNIVIKPMLTLKEIKEVGDKMHHCIYSGRFYNSELNLLLCAYQNNEPIETSQFLLNKMEVEQSRGLQNQPSPYHKEIVNVINKHKKEIQKCLVVPKKRKKKSNLKQVA